MEQQALEMEQSEDGGATFAMVRYVIGTIKNPLFFEGWII